MSQLRRLWVSPYVLKSAAGNLTEVEGLLLRCEFCESSLDMGYGCLQSWPELGEPGLRELLPSLSAGFRSPEPLVQRALDMAKEDALGRTHQQSLLNLNHMIPLSHILNPVPGSDLDGLGYSHLKIKLRAENQREVRDTLELWLGSLSPHQRLRLDFNGSFHSATQFINWWRDFQAILEPWIDFIEDPISDATLESWMEMEGWAPVAADRQLDFEVLRQAKIRIWKPLVGDMDWARKSSGVQRVITTTNLDHPLGQVYAMLQAQKFTSDEVCGLQTKDFYQPDEFSESISYQGPQAHVEVEGGGLGFESQLKARNWKEVEVL